MSSPLHKAPSGLLAELALKVSGQNPAQFGGEVTPTFDVRAHYRVEQRAMAFVSTSHSLSGTGPILTVPAGEYWIVRQIGASCLTIPAVSEWGLGLRYLERSTFGSLGGGIPLAAQYGPTYNDIIVGQVSYQPTVQDFFLLPGDRLQAFFIRTLAAAQSIALFCLHDRILLNQ